MERTRTPGQIQKAWDKTPPNKPIYKADYCKACTYKIRLREFMVTVLELPEGEVIEAVDLGDKKGFSAQPRGNKRLALRPKGHGYDTSLVVYGKSGRVYPFYLRAEGFNSNNIPDLVVKIIGPVPIGENLSVEGFEGVNDKGSKVAAIPLSNGEVDKAINGLGNTNPKTPDKDFVAEATFDPNALRGWGKYKLWGSEELKPETVFRDDQFTYIRFGDKWKDIELPTAYVVVDKIDELVNTRVQGQTFIVESTRELITLKSGQSYLCIEYPGDEG
ncbi:MAG: TrbG/VirB9 family P-type conjugative transfer protein [Alphaproteobacteria bacterium]|nr:TrbG/VirB9 family P-type conjugative transfer protein [Rhodospirillales bacterium]MCW9045309.1 TrbG/VirB9 family P-type conjugative transfer protein [Alphaproteobacteria bacterium]